MAACTATLQPYPEHPERFDVWPQNTCVDTVTGRRSGAGLVVWEYQMSYKSISRKGRGNESKRGCNDQSRRLFCSFSGYLFSHNNNNLNSLYSPDPLE